MRYDLVLHVDKLDGSLAVGLNNAVNYARALPGGGFRMALVVNSMAVEELRADNAAIKTRLEEAVTAGLIVKVCQNALRERGLDPRALYPHCEVVPAGIVEIVSLQQDGYAYVKV